MTLLLKWALVGVPVATVAILAGCTMTRAGYKSPAYTVRARFERVEVRDYQTLVLAQTPTRKEAEGRDGSFMRLFRFISKGNASSLPIPMTTPVLCRGEGADEAMAFVLPATMKPAEVPAPQDAQVHIVTRAAGTFATLRMRGRRAASREEALSEMSSALERTGWKTQGKPEFAFYDPPWIPGFMEKNELLWRVVRSE